MNTKQTNPNNIEGPFAPDLTRVVDELFTKLKGDKVTESQDVLTTLSSAETASLRSTILQSMVYIKRTKQVIGVLHELVDNYKRQIQAQRELLKHCLTQHENPKARNQDIIVKAIRQHLEDK